MKYLILLLAALGTGCGRVHQLNAGEIEGRITNGTDAVPGQCPFQVMLLLENELMCGGSILNRRHLLTAAHCTYTVEYGISFIGFTVAGAPSTTRKFTKDDIIIHKYWDDVDLTNDISIIKIEKITFSVLIQPVRLLNTNADLVGEVVTATGWGDTSDENLPAPKNLQTVDLKVISNEGCNAYYFSIIDSMLCTDTTGGKSTCDGDSGGPLVMKGTNVQVGIASFVPAFGCTSGDPAAFTRVTSYVPWINAVLSA